MQPTRMATIEELIELQEAIVKKLFNPNQAIWHQHKYRAAVRKLNELKKKQRLNKFKLIA